MQTVCVELLTACVKIDRNTSIPQSLLATIHTGEEKTQAASSESPESSWGQRTSACLHSYNGMFSESLGKLENK